MGRIRTRATTLVAVIALGAAGLATVATSYAFPSQSTVYQTHGGCQTSQTALASITGGGLYRLHVFHEDYLDCVGTVYSQAKWHDGSSIVYTDPVSHSYFAEPTPINVSYYYYGYGWGKSSADHVWWGTNSVDP